MKMPIIVSEHGDIAIFKSKKDAELKLEAIDVNNNEYLAYDREGLVLKLRVVQHKNQLANKTANIAFDVICITETDIKRPDDLANLLRAFLLKTGNKGLMEKSLTLDDLVIMSIATFGYTY